MPEEVSWPGASTTRLSCDVCPALMRTLNTRVQHPGRANDDVEQPCRHAARGERRVLPHGCRRHHVARDLRHAAGPEHRDCRARRRAVGAQHRAGERPVPVRRRDLQVERLRVEHLPRLQGDAGQALHVVARAKAAMSMEPIGRCAAETRRCPWSGREGASGQVRRSCGPGRSGPARRPLPRCRAGKRSRPTAALRRRARRVFAPAASSDSQMTRRRSN